jgi:hypothetical protein
VNFSHNPKFEILGCDTKPKAKSKKMGPTDPVEEEETVEAKVEAEPRSEKEEENLGKASP